MATYANIGVIGNSGTPPDVWGHNACWPEGLARDSSDNIYEVRGFDEPHHDIAVRSPSTGLITWTTEQVQGDLMIAIAVEPDGSWAYTAGFSLDYGTTPPRQQTYIYRINLALGMDRNARRTDFTTAGHHIQTYAYGDIAGEPISGGPLHSIQIAGSSIWVSDSYGNRLIKYDKVSGVQQQVITSIPGARGLVIDASGNLWVGCNTTQVRCYSSTGTLLNTSTLSTATSTIIALSYVGTTMAVAFLRDGVHTYTISGSTLTTKLSSYGQAFRPGDKDNDRVRELSNMVMLSDGSIIISDRMGYYGRVQKVGGWVQYGLEFTASMSFAPERPDLWISSDRQCYTVGTDASWTFAGNGQTEIFPQSNTEPAYMGHYQSTHMGIPRLLKLGSNYFFYYPAGYEIGSLGIYRVIDNAGRGPSLQLCSIIGTGQPSPTGQNMVPFWMDENKYTWTWNDPVGDGVVRPADVTSIFKPGDPDITMSWWSTCYTVDEEGTVWARDAMHGRECIVKFPLTGLNGIGNPIYNFAGKTQVFNYTDGQALVGSTAHFEFQTPYRADGDVYALCKSFDPAFPDNPAGHAGGNCIVCFSPTGTPKWGKVLPFWGMGFCVINDGGGFLVGSNDPPTKNNTIFHYDVDGNQLKKIFPDSLYGDNITRWFGGFDSRMSVNCQRDPRDGKVKIFAADNMSQRIIVHSIDDGSQPQPPDENMTVNLEWDAPNPSPESYAVYKHNGEPGKVGTSTSTTTSVQGNYGDRFSVRSVGPGGESKDSNIVTVEAAAPVAPTNLRIQSIT